MKNEERKPAYKLINTVDLEEAAKKGESILYESDLALQNEKFLFQYKEIEEDEKKKPKTKIKPGIWNLESSPVGILPVETELQKSRLLKTNDNSEKILNEFRFFFERLDVYDELDILKKRGVLLYGPPGLGKSATIAQAASELSEQGKAAIISWNASAIRSSDILDFFSTGVEYDGVGKLVVIIEDIGMGVEGYGGAKEVDRSLLNLLDGSSNVVKVPTFFIATTNYAHNLPEPLVRPGRFDEWIEVDYPSPEERVKLVEFIAKDSLTEEEKTAIMGKELDEFSIAHLKEVVVRSKRDGLTMKEVVERLNQHKKRFQKGFADHKPTGLL